MSPKDDERTDGQAGAATVAESDAMTRFDEAVNRISDLPTLPNILMQIWTILESPNSSSSDLEKVIALDQSMTAKIVRLANSPFYYTHGEISTVKSAIVNVGFDAVKNLVIAVSVTSMLKKLKGTNKFLPLKEFWRHSVGVGVASRELARKIEGVDAELCFCAGILHDIGKFAMNLLFPDEFAEALSLASTSNIYIRDAEEKVIGIDHAGIGELFAKHWSFSRPLRRIVGDHHKIPEDMDDEFLLEASIVQMCDSIVRDMEFGFPGDFMKGRDYEGLVMLFGMEESFIEEFKAGLFNKIQAAGEILNLV